MNANRRVHRDTGQPRGAGQRTPRSGGRTVAQRAVRPGVANIPVVARGARARGAREFAIEGTAALRTQPRVDDEPEAQVWAEAATPKPGGPSGRASRPSAGTPRLKVAPPVPVARPRAPFVGLVLVLVVSGVLGILLIQTKVNENAFRLDKLQDQQAALDVQEQQLEREIARYEDPGNLAAQARKLGLVESGPPAFIRLPDGKVIGVPQPAQGEPAITSQQGTGG